MAGNSAENLNQQTTEATSERETLGILAKELCISWGFTATPYYLDKNSLTEWLTQEGCLVAAGSQVTAKGTACGFDAVQGTNSQGETYTTVSCGEQGKALLQNSMAGIIACEKRQWEPLLACLTPEWQGRAAISEAPVTLTAIVKQINGSLPGDLPRRLTVPRVNLWMVKNKLMEDAVLKGKRLRVPTAAGENIGISVTIQARKDSSIRWSASAQRFVWENLDRIVRDLASGETYRWGPRELVVSGELRRGLLPVPKPVNWAYVEKVINNTLRGGGDYPNPMPVQLVLSWLFHEQYITYTKGPDGKGKHLPTESGKAAGLIFQEGRLLFPEAGQQFIYDHLQQIFDYHGTLKT